MLAYGATTVHPPGLCASYAWCRGKVLALELIKNSLENSGTTFRRSEKFIGAIRQFLCLSLLKNSASSVPQVLQLACSIFLTLLFKFRTSLKAEVGVWSMLDNRLAMVAHWQHTSLACSMLCSTLAWVAFMAR